MSWSLSSCELSIQKLLRSTRIEISGDMVYPLHLVPFEIVRDGLHFCSLQDYFFRTILFVEPLHPKQATKTAHMEFVQLFYMSGVNCPGFAGIEKHWNDCCSIDWFL